MIVFKDNDFYTVKDLMAKLGLCRQTVYIYIKKYKLKKHKFGRSNYYSAKDFRKIFRK
jgi:hypothetical protein